MKKAVWFWTLAACLTANAQQAVVMPWPAFIPVISQQWWSAFTDPPPFFTVDDFDGDELVIEIVDDAFIDASPSIREEVTKADIEMLEEELYRWGCIDAVDFHKYYKQLGAIITDKLQTKTWKVVHVIGRTGIDLVCIYTTEPAMNEPESAFDTIADEIRDFFDDLLEDEKHNEVNYALGALRLLPNQSPFNRFLYVPDASAEEIAYQTQKWSGGIYVHGQYTTNVEYIGANEAEGIIKAVLALNSTEFDPEKVVEVIAPNNIDDFAGTIRLPDREIVINFLRDAQEVLSITESLPVLKDLVDIYEDVLGVSRGFNDWLRDVTDKMLYWNDLSHLITVDGIDFDGRISCKEWRQVGAFRLFGITDPFQVHPPDGLDNQIAAIVPEVEKPCDCDFTCPEGKEALNARGRSIGGVRGWITNRNKPVKRIQQRSKWHWWKKKGRGGNRR